MDFGKSEVYATKKELNYMALIYGWHLWENNQITDQEFNDLRDSSKR